MQAETHTHTRTHSHAVIHMQKLQKDWPKVKHFDMHLNGIISIRFRGPPNATTWKTREKQQQKRETRGIGIKKHTAHTLQEALEKRVCTHYSGHEILYISH